MYHICSALQVGDVINHSPGYSRCAVLDAFPYMSYASEVISTLLLAQPGLGWEEKCDKCFNRLSGQASVSLKTNPTKVAI